MSNPNDQAFPGIAPPMHINPKSGEIRVLGGLTKREYFAAHAPEVSRLRRDEAEVFIGKPFPEHGTVAEKIGWSSQVDAKMRAIYADALLAELTQNDRK